MSDDKPTPASLGRALDYATDWIRCLQDPGHDQGDAAWWRQLAEEQPGGDKICQLIDQLLAP